ncbi:MAG TPA: hypothetical protein VF433_07525, partial [Cellvibrio sp.]
MVYTTQRFKVIPKPSDQPISIGEDVPTPSGTGALGPLNNLLQQLFPGYRPIDFPTPSTSSDGGIPDVVGPGGGGATGSGLGEGELVKVEVPSSAASGSTFLIKTTFKNKSASTQNFSLHIVIPSLGIATITPTVALTSGQQSIIESTIILPNVQYGGNFPGAVELRSVTGTNVILFQDSEAFTLAVVGSGTGSSTGGATITPSATTVKQGQSISINCLGFGANERVDFIAKVGSTTVSTDNKTSGANGALVLDTLTFYTTAPLGTAVITATGATSGKTATAQVTVVSSSTSTGGTASITTNKSSYVKGQTVSVTGTGYLAGEKVKLWLSKDGITRCTAGDMTATSSGTVSGSINACYVASSGLNVRAQGRTSGRMGVKGITVTDSTSGGTTTARIT